MVLGVDDPGLAQQHEQFGVGTVHVRESDYAIDSARLHRRGLRRRLPRTAAGDGVSTKQDSERGRRAVRSSTKSSARLRGDQGDLAAIDALEQLSSAAGAPSDLRLGQSHLHLFAFAADAAVLRQFLPLATGT